MPIVLSTFFCLSALRLPILNLALKCLIYKSNFIATFKFNLIVFVCKCKELMVASIESFRRVLFIARVGVAKAPKKFIILLCTKMKPHTQPLHTCYKSNFIATFTFNLTVFVCSKCKELMVAGIKSLRRVLFTVRVGVAKAPKVCYFALYQNEISHTAFACLLTIRKL